MQVTNGSTDGGAGRAAGVAPLRLMAVHAHPDDESSKGAATLARYVDQGAEVMVVSCTGGERGDILNPALKGDPAIERDLPEVRRHEMARAVEVLGVRHVWLGFVDSGLPEGDPLPPLPDGCFALEPLPVAAAPLVALVRSFRPHVMVTYDETGGYPHPDHVMCHRVSVEAFHAAADPQRYPEAGRAWRTDKLYYDRGFTKRRFAALNEAMAREGIESPFQEWLSRWDDRPEVRVTTSVPCSDQFEKRDLALLAHATQIDPNGAFFAVPRDLQAEAWPTEEYELAFSHVGGPARPPGVEAEQLRGWVPDEELEDDLFAGVVPGPTDPQEG